MVPFGAGDLDFLVPGMSDVMPYRSTRFAAMDALQLERYRAVWRSRVAAAVERFAPDVIHSHHVWLLSAVVKDVVSALLRDEFAAAVGSAGADDDEPGGSGDLDGGGAYAAAGAVYQNGLAGPGVAALVECAPGGGVGNAQRGAL